MHRWNLREGIMTHRFLNGCKRCGRVVPGQIELCEVCWTHWIRDVLVFAAATTVLLVTLATWGAQ